MKKLLSFLYFVGLICCYTYSQSLSLSNSQGPIPNDTTIIPHGNLLSNEIIAYAWVTNNATTAVPVKVKKIEVHITQGTTNSFCWGQCYPPDVYVSLQTITIDPGKTDSSDFSGHLSPNGISGYDLIRYVFYNESYPADSVCMNVDFTHFPVGIENCGIKPTLSEAFPNPVSGNFQLKYTLPANLAGKIIILNESGVTVKEISLPMGAGNITINTDQMNDGVYFYSLFTRGKISSAKRLIVKH